MKLYSHRGLPAPTLQETGQWPLMDFNWGLEKESLRLTAEGQFSQRDHPVSLQAPAFTRDFAENQLEMATGIERSPEAVIARMESLYRQAEAGIGREVLWPLSMPPAPVDESTVRIASFSGSREAREATIYRQGLALRYGIRSQLISGLHVNVSLGDHLLEKLADGPGDPISRRISRDNVYMNLVRGLYRRLPLLYLLFSHSPISDNETAPFPVLSVRKSGRGYPSLANFLNLGSLPAYIGGIQSARSTWSPYYAHLERKGTRLAAQLNHNILQDDREFYVPVRLKASGSARAEGLDNTDGLEQYGIQYLELRFPDLDPSEQAGISVEKIRLLQLVLWSLTQENHPPFETGELPALLGTLSRLASSPLAQLFDDWTDEIEEGRSWLASLCPLARSMDEQNGGENTVYQSALIQAIRELQSICSLPSGRLWHSFRCSGLSWSEFGLKQSNLLSISRHEYQRICCS